MGDDVKMADTHEILPVYQPNAQGAFNAYKVRAVPCIFPRWLLILSVLCGPRIMLAIGVDVYYLLHFEGIRSSTDVSPHVQ